MRDSRALVEVISGCGEPQVPRLGLLDEGRLDAVARVRGPAARVASNGGKVVKIIIMHVGSTDVSITGWFILLGALGILGGVAK